MLNKKGLKQLMKLTGGKMKKGTRQNALHYVNTDPANRMILSQWLPIYYRNIIDNYFKIDQGASLKKMINPNEIKIALIVSHGPSLDQVIDKIKDVRGQVIVIACDSVLNVLDANDIMPDIVVNAHCTEKIKNVVEGIDTSKYTLAAPTVCHKDVFESWQGQKLFYNIYHPNLEFFELGLPSLFPKMPRIPNAGSTAGVCVHIANLLGCDPIIMCGVDFGFPDNKYCCKSYKRDSKGRARVKKINHEKKIVDSIRGEHKYNDVRCWPEHIRYRDAIQIIRMNRSIRLMRGTKGGIMDKDLEYVDIADLDSLKPKTNMEKYDIAYKQPFYGSVNASIGLKYADVALETCPGVKSVLDVGCGPGWAVRRFRQRGLTAIGVEPCQHLHDTVIKGMEDFIINESAQELPFANNKFDLVYCTEVLEHIPEEDAIKAIEEMVNVARKYIFCTIAYEKAISMPSLNLHCTLRPREWWDKQFMKYNLTRIRADRVFIYKKRS